MDKENNKISIRQLVIIFLICTASPIIRVLPNYVVEIAQNASLLSPILAIIPIMILFIVLNKLITKTKQPSLADVFNKVIGKVGGKILSVMYIAWLFILTALYARYFAERFESTIFVFVTDEFLLASMLLTVYFVCQREMKYFARFVELVMLFFIVVVIFTFLVGLPQIKINNIFPIIPSDIKPVIISTYPIIGIWSYITAMFFLGDNVSDLKEFKKTFKLMSISLVVMSLNTLLVTLGVFGVKLTSVLNMPFFVFYKNIRILTIIERIESVVLSLWTVTDFIIITIFVYIIIRLIKKTFSLKSSKEIVGPTMFIIYIFAQYIALNIFELNQFSNSFFLTINIIFGLAIPIVIYIIGKVRKMV